MYSSDQPSRSYAPPQGYAHHQQVPRQGSPLGEDRGAKKLHKAPPGVGEMRYGPSQTQGQSIPMNAPVNDSRTKTELRPFAPPKEAYLNRSRLRVNGLFIVAGIIIGGIIALIILGIKKKL